MRPCRLYRSFYVSDWCWTWISLRECFFCFLWRDRLNRIICTNCSKGNTLSSINHKECEHYLKAGSCSTDECTWRAECQKARRKTLKKHASAWILLCVKLNNIDSFDVKKAETSLVHAVINEAHHKEKVNMSFVSDGTQSSPRYCLLQGRAGSSRFDVHEARTSL